MMQMALSFIQQSHYFCATAERYVTQYALQFSSEEESVNSHLLSVAVTYMSPEQLEMAGSNGHINS